VGNSFEEIALGAWMRVFETGARERHICSCGNIVGNFRAHSRGEGGGPGKVPTSILRAGGR